MQGEWLKYKIEYQDSEELDYTSKAYMFKKLSTGKNMQGSGDSMKGQTSLIIDIDEGEELQAISKS